MDSKATCKALVGLFFCLALLGCENTFRSVAIPIANGSPGDPKALQVAAVIGNANGAIGSATHINVSGDTNVGIVPLGSGPVHATLGAASIRIYVADSTGDAVTVYSTFSPLAPSTVTISLPAGSTPVFVHRPRNISTVFVALSGANAVGVISGQDVLSATVPVGVRPVAMASTFDGTKLYVVNQGSGTVSVIATADNQLLSTLTVGASPSWIASSDDGAKMFVVNTASNTVSIIDTTTDTITGTIPVGAGPTFVIFDARLRRAYVANTAGNSVSVLKADVLPVTLLATVPVGSAPTSIAPLADGSRAYVANSGGNTVSVISTLNNTVTKTITVGSAPVFVAAATDSSRVYVANRDSDSVSIIRTLDDTELRDSNNNLLRYSVPKPVFVLIAQ